MSSLPKELKEHIKEFSNIIDNKICENTSLKKLIDTYNALKDNKDIGYNITLQKCNNSDKTRLDICVYIDANNKDSDKYINLIHSYHDSIKKNKYEDIILNSDIHGCTIFASQFL